MSLEAHSRGRALEEGRAGVVARLRSRREELEDVIFVRLRDDPLDSVGREDAEYTVGWRQAIAAAVDYVLQGIERGGAEWSGLIPAEVISQARRAARTGVSLDTVIRHYVAAYTLVETFIVEEADRGDLSGEGGTLRGILGVRASLIDRLLTGITSEYGGELQRAERSPEQCRIQLVHALLAGAVLDTADLGYDLDRWHLGVIATGAGGGEAVRGLAAGVDCRVLSVSHGEGTVWAWLGGRRRLAAADMGPALAGERSAGVVLAVGEPAQGIEGWRLTHRQAQAALLVARRRPKPQGLTLYADVALLALALGDDLLARSLIEVFLSPLDSQRDSGAVSRETLRAYFAAGRNASSAAAALGVARHTVENRLRTVEQTLGRSIQTCLTEMDVALRLDDLADVADSRNPSPAR